MAGMRAAIAAPTWPDINGSFIPATIGELSPAIKNIAYNPLTVHFIHRGLAYLLFVLVLVWWFKSKIVSGSPLFSKLRNVFFVLLVTQVALGILTVLNATHANRLVWLGVSHQFTAMLVLMVLVSLLFIVKKKQPIY